MLKQPILALPASARMEPVDSDEFAKFVVECLTDGQRGERQDFAGPETLRLPELMQQYLSARDLQRRIRIAPVPNKIQAAVTAGNTSSNARRGKTTWAEWLRRQLDVPLVAAQLMLGFTDR